MSPRVRNEIHVGKVYILKHKEELNFDHQNIHSFTSAKDQNHKYNHINQNTIYKKPEFKLKLQPTYLAILNFIRITKIDIAQ